MVLTTTCILLCSCASAPGKYHFKNSVTVKDSYDITWSRVVEYFASNNIKIKNITKDSGIIAAEKSQFGNDYADYEKSGLDTPVKTIRIFNVFVKTTANNQVVSVNSDFSQMRQSGWDGPIYNVACNSKGVVERAILNSAKGNDS